MAMSCVNTQNLLAVALVINRSRDGPAFVFHWPPDVQPVSGNPEPVEAEDLLLERLSLHAKRDVGAPDPPTTHRHHDDHHHLMVESGSPAVPWEHLAGFPTRDLAGILTPARSYHKKLFQLSLDPLLCISYPIHVPDNGKWKRPKKARASKQLDDHICPHETEAPPPTPKDNPKKEEADDEKRSSMTMFNLVFILNPKKNEVKDLVDLLHGNIVKKVNKAYKYSQQHSDFIWKESKRILAAKDKAREDRTGMGLLWKELLHMSSLAASVHEIYEAVSQNRIAALHLDTAAGVLTPSVQIPAPFYVSDTPAEHEQGQRGLWLTTANAFLSQDALDEPGFLDRNFALLLMDDEKKIISELQADRDPTTVSMVEFVRLAKPTMSFYQVGQSNVLTLGQVRKYAQHFIFWRRAIAIPPLHARDTYIVSPNSDLARLPSASQEWQRAFPVAPPLPNFLAELSMCPKPYKTFCPSKTHRPLYLRMLAWLMRGGWVTQICTFGYVIVWPEILYEIDYEIEAEELAAAAEEARAQEKADDATSAPDDGSSSSPALNQHHPNAQHSEDTTGNVANTTATPRSTTQHAAEMARLERIALKAHREAADKATAHARKAVPVATAHPSTNDAPHLAGITPHIILDAKKTTGKESRYLSAIARRLKDNKLRSAWQLTCKYFDGRCALERIALQEDMKRKEVWTLLTGMSEYLLCTRHW
ncbi:nitrogen permease regulator of amino acid transport activity 3 domain-containing protein [Hirsutella rhossiliensis]|uniref:Nitrogen permease regulator 3 n=1 Tax=Hirsutella rhossiliensis TaxID=111463 RepID=A0A9P8SDS1_9HYPO|nr:nitrogen permease regulator of amino acid transport activity 3 domain-containing protein [Hirsutella rhossiliensis]KAH0957306.1 nitrogen permease regulator of amino acid transport activity 3 domain-containing protein [Hirsutella rhossiliensis]